MNYPKQSKDLASQKFHEGVVVLDLFNDRMFHSLNETAAFVWQQCNGENSWEDIAQHLTTEFDIDIESARADTREILDHLENKKLITWK